MKNIWFCCLLAVASLATSATRVDAAYCGLASYERAAGKMTTVSFAKARQSCAGHEAAGDPSCAAAPSCCGTRMVKDVIYEQQEYTCYKTVCEKVVEQREVNCIRYETERGCKEVEYTVCKPVWETRARSIPYTVCKPVYETRTKEIPYTVCKPVYEELQETYTVCKPVYETRTR